MATTHIRRADTIEEIKPLIDLCKAGQLFEVQDWINARKPVNPPPNPPKGRGHRQPLDFAIAAGFHSLVKVLLEGGAIIEPNNEEPLLQAVRRKRLDMVRLFIEHGADPKQVDMVEVFECWEPQMMEYFIALGADLEKGNPLAGAFTYRVRTALGIYKKYKDRYPGFQEQINIALRYHCAQGNLKWVSLMLWAGADPYAPGTEDFQCEEVPDYGGFSAVEYAAMHNQLGVFKLRKLRLDPNQLAVKSFMHSVSSDEGIEILIQLLDNGMNPNDQGNGGCSGYYSLLIRLEADIRAGNYWTAPSLHSLLSGDNDQSRTRMKAIHLLAQHGAQWVPEVKDEINSIRRSLLKMKADYTLEFVWIMAEYQACDRALVEDLLRTQSIKRLTENYTARLRELTEKLPSAQHDSD